MGVNVCLALCPGRRRCPPDHLVISIPRRTTPVACSHRRGPAREAAQLIQLFNSDSLSYGLFGEFDDFAQAPAPTGKTALTDSLDELATGY
jgi:hypothetical protein